MRGFDPPDPRQRNVTLVKGVGYSKTIVHVEVRAGALPRDPEVAWMELENRRAEQGAVCLVPPDYPDQLRRDVNMAMAGRLIRSRPPEEASEMIALDLLVPQAEAREGMVWVVFTNHRNYLLRTRWKVCKVHPDGSMTFAKTTAERTLTAANISSLKNYLSFVERRRIQVVCGMRLHVETSFSQLKPKKISLTPGEIVTVQRLAEDGALQLADGRVIPPTFRAFAPAFLLRKVPHGKTRPEVILAEAPKSDGRAWALGIRPRKLIVFSADPERFAGELACEQAFLEVQKRLKKTLRFVSGEGEFVPSLERCEKIISLHEGNIRVGGPSEIATPGQECIPVSPEVSRKKSAEVEEEEPKKAVKKPDEAPVLVPEEPVQCKPKKESEDQEMK